MPETAPARIGEVAVSLPQSFDAGLHFIGRIRTPWPTLADCPKNTGERREVTATVEVDELYSAGLKDIDRLSHLVLLYWLDRSRRDLVIQSPRHAPEPRGVFALRSPVRPNPIGLAVVDLVAVEGARLSVRNIDCVDGTPLVDIKPYFATTDSFPNARRP